MRKVNKLVFGISVFAGSLLITLILYPFIGMFSSIIVMGCINWIMWLDTATVNINTITSCKNFWSGELDNRSYKEGFYWTYGFTYVPQKERDNTKNEYSVTVTGDTNNGIRGELPVSLWAWINNIYKYERIGDDAKDDIINDLTDTIKAYISRKSDIELRTLQGRKIGLSEVIEKSSDTLWTTLEDAGLYTKDEDDISMLPVLRFGTFQVPQSIIDADLKRAEAERIARGDDFDNKERTKRVLEIFINKLISYIRPVTTLRELKKDAIESLGLSGTEFSHEQEYEIIDEMRKIAINSISSLDPKSIDKMLEDSEEDLNIREKRTQAYKGLGNARAMFNPKN